MSTESAATAAPHKLSPADHARALRLFLHRRLDVLFKRISAPDYTGYFLIEQHAKANYAVPSICIGPGAAAPTQIKPLPIAETSDALLQGLRTLTGKPDLVLSDEDARAMLAQAIGMMGSGGAGKK